MLRLFVKSLIYCYANKKGSTSLNFKRFFYFLLGMGLIVFFTGSQLWAKVILVETRVPIYTKPFPGSIQLKETIPGERMNVILNQKTNGFYKVQIQYRGKIQIGYLSEKDLVKTQKYAFQIKKRQKEDRLEEIAFYSKEKAYGLGFNLSYVNQGPQSFEDASSTIREVGGVSGFAYYPRFFYDQKFGNNHFLELFLSFRKFAASGQQDRYAGSVYKQDISVEHNFISLGAIYKIHFSTPKYNFWYGPGLEIGRALSSKYTVDSESKELNKGHKPFFIAPQAYVGFDHPFYKKWYFLPALNASLIPTMTPTVINLEILLNLAYAF